MVLTYCLATAPSYLVDINIFNSLFMKCFMKKKPDFETYSNYSDGRSHRINVYCSLAHILFYSSDRLMHLVLLPWKDD